MAWGVQLCHARGLRQHKGSLKRQFSPFQAASNDYSNDIKGSLKV
nr:hypothetical protein [uncultured Kingella sp.]